MRVQGSFKYKTKVQFLSGRCCPCPFHSLEAMLDLLICASSLPRSLHLFVSQSQGFLQSHGSLSGITEQPQKCWRFNGPRSTPSTYEKWESPYKTQASQTPSEQFCGVFHPISQIAPSEIEPLFLHITSYGCTFIATSFLPHSFSTLLLMLPGVLPHKPPASKFLSQSLLLRKSRYSLNLAYRWV